MMDETLLYVWGLLFSNNQGYCRGSDQHTNIILEKCYERVFSKEHGVETVELGLYVVRGDNMY